MSTIAQNYSKLSDFPEEIRKTNPFKRFEWAYTQRAFPYDTIPYMYAQKVANKEMDKIKSGFYKTKSQMNWQAKGPFGFTLIPYYASFGICSGRIRALAVHPTDPLTVYIGAASGGIWKTNDGGDTWIDIGRNLESLGFGAITIDPNNPEVIYAGSGEACSVTGITFFNGRGLFKSTNGGMNWTKINHGFGQYTHFSDIAVAPSNSDIVIATLANGSYNLGFTLSSEGIWKSTDAGLTWEKKTELTDAYDVLFHPNNSDTIYAAIGGSTDQSGLYISTDQGESWVASNTGLQSSNTISRIQIDISQSNPEIMYAVTYECSGLSDIFIGTTRAFKSENGGENWFQISEEVRLAIDFYDLGYYALSIVVDPIDPDHVLIGKAMLYETFDGENFNISTNNNSIHNDIHKLVFAPSNPDYFYIACDGGIYQSSDGFNTVVSKNSGLETLQLYNLGSHPTDPDIMICGMQDNCTAITFDGGDTWKGVAGGDGMVCFFDHTNPQNVYASAQNGWLMKSTDGGKTFSFKKNMNGAWVTPFFMHPFASDTLYSANKNIYRTTFTFLYQITTNLSPVLINTMDQSSVNPDKMILAGGGSMENNSYPGIPFPDSQYVAMVSVDGGYNWDDITANIPGEIRWISKVLADPVDENTMYIVRCGFSAGNKIYKSENLGDTWTNISGDLPDIPCNDLFIDPEIPDHIFVGTDMGVYLSQDGGNTYNYAGNGMPIVPIMDFDYVKIDGIRYLRVGTHGRSIYETTNLPNGISENRLSKRTQIKVSPNPFNRSTTLEYELQQATQVQISIYNYLGEQVDIIRKNQSQGLQKLVWNPNNLPDGIYFYKLQAGEQMASGKMVMMR
ncbi:MAG: T9SS type A sorting domain-containing protein [Bacteroidales bacterium]|nr:T9SS type A sorting domain-containing protein [Bacteroidales bacterium]